MDRGGRKGLAVFVAVVIVIAVMLALPGHKKVHPPNDDPWVLVSYDPDNPVGTYLGNGFISTRIMGDGVGSQRTWMPDGTLQIPPLPCYMAGVYDDEKLVPIPTWSDIQFGGDDGSDWFRVDKNDYRQTLDLRTGILRTETIWRTASTPSLKGSVEVFVSRANPNVAVMRAVLTPLKDRTIAVIAELHNPGSLQLVREYDKCNMSCQTKQSKIPVGIAADISVEPHDQRGLDGWLSQDSEWRDRPDHVLIAAKRGQTITITRCVAIATASTPEAAHETATAVLRAARQDLDAVIAAHKDAWAKLWQKDIKIDGPKKDQQAIHSCMFYLLQSVREGSQWSIPPMGLSNNSFSGHVFWDADTWMFPALILQHPELARSIVDYRYNTLPGAMANAKADGFAGAEYAWESGMTGKEDTPEGLVYRYERHIDGDVALAQWQYYLATGDLNWLKTRGLPVIRATADYWVSRATKSADGSKYEIKQVVPPDENAEKVDNNAYTNAIAKMNLQIASRAAGLCGVAANSKWAEVADKLYIPFDDSKKRFIPFDGYKGWKAKQADVELLAYPLQFELPGYVMPFIYRNTYDYYAPKVMASGPAMTASAHAVIAARLSLGDDAYIEFLKSYKPFLRGPFNYFNEKQSKTWDNMCFLTGAAGPIQAAIFGLAGAQMNYFPQNPAKAELSFNPQLPSKWKSLKITGVQWHGKTFDVEVKRGNKAEIIQE